MPIGVQLLGKYFDEGTILNLAYAYEQEMKFPTIPDRLKG
jgi:Asp-tRNA(Asn)/Glu-tRNA(Gln) amidotransferase A subunit family amidase